MPATMIIETIDYDNVPADLDAAWETASWAWESLSETEGQYRSEVAQFGDAWPGAAIDVANARKWAAEAEAAAQHLESIYGYGPAQGPVFYDALYEDGDEPF